MKSLIILGASGVGKGTIIKALLSSLKLHNTLSKAKLKAWVSLFLCKRIQNMLEHKVVFGNHYGTSHHHLQQLLSQGLIPVLDIDVEGMLQINAKIDCQILCVLPPSWQTLRQRLEGRKSEAKQVIDKRMEENKLQIAKMLSLKGIPNLNYITNYEYPLTIYGIELWLYDNFIKFRHQYPKQ